MSTLSEQRFSPNLLLLKPLTPLLKFYDRNQRTSFTFFFPPPETKCKTGALDIVFVIDSSRSVRPYEFETMRRFMIDIIHNLDIGPNATRVGVIQYSSQVQNIFSLKSFFTRAEMEKAINSIVPLAQGTMTGLAIQYAMNVAFTVQNGARPLHRKIPRVAVIVTDGRPQDRVTEVAAQARAAGIEIYAVGVQRADMNSLRAMASPPLEEHVFLVESFDLIQQFGKQFQDKLCEYYNPQHIFPSQYENLFLSGVDMCTELDHGCQHTCVSIPSSFYCQCKPGYKLNADGKTCASKIIDACANQRHGCEHQCVNSQGTFICRCQTGYQLNQDKKTCINGYYCRCRDGFTLQEDGKTCQGTFYIWLAVAMYALILSHVAHT
uniref:VWFA domain-containing protein n=1 Tax=Pseudonaja textilis TaxID=8673 RepID=A0A670YHT2_PSETE